MKVLYDIDRGCFLVFESGHEILIESIVQCKVINHVLYQDKYLLVDTDKGNYIIEIDKLHETAEVKMKCYGIFSNYSNKDFNPEHIPCFDSHGNLVIINLNNFHVKNICKFNRSKNFLISSGDKRFIIEQEGMAYIYNDHLLCKIKRNSIVFSKDFLDGKTDFFIEISKRKMCLWKEDKKVISINNYMSTFPTLTVNSSYKVDLDFFMKSQYFEINENTKYISFNNSKNSVDIYEIDNNNIRKVDTLKMDTLKIKNCNYLFPVSVSDKKGKIAFITEQYDIIMYDINNKQYEIIGNLNNLLTTNNYLTVFFLFNSVINYCSGIKNYYLSKHNDELFLNFSDSLKTEILDFYVLNEHEDIFIFLFPQGYTNNLSKITPEGLKILYPNINKYDFATDYFILKNKMLMFTDKENILIDINTGEITPLNIDKQVKRCNYLFDDLFYITYSDGTSAIFNFKENKVKDSGDITYVLYDHIKENDFKYFATLKKNQNCLSCYDRNGNITCNLPANNSKIQSLYKDSIFWNGYVNHYQWYFFEQETISKQISINSIFSKIQKNTPQQTLKL